MTGYESKRAAARDRMLDDDDALTIAYQSGFYDGKKAAQPAQEPVAWMYQCTVDNSEPVLLRKKQNWAESGTGLWVETPLSTTPPQRTKQCNYPDCKCPTENPCLKGLAQPAQEPVAHLCGPDENGLFGLPTADKACKDCFPVYTTPPQRPWVDLTNDDIFAAVRHLYGTAESAFMGRIDDIATARAIETKLKMIHSKTTPPQPAQEREALKLALEVLENLPGFRADIDNAITVIKEVLEKTHEN